MPRKARRKSKTGIYHVMLRGINRHSIFESENDKSRFISIVSEYRESEKFRVFGYCLMDNHTHLLIQEGEDDISTVVKRISSSYVYWYNKKYERVGHLFQERFKSECVEDESYFLAVLRYIHQNPVKAGIVKSIDKYNWSSYGCYIKEIDIIDYKYGLSIFSENTSEAKSQFIKYMSEESKANFLDYDDFSKLTDAEVKREILSMGVNEIGDLKSIEKEKRNLILKELKGIKGVSIRQLSRITGLSRTMITEA
ncbi:transposase [Proteiniborus sp. MB09-C3]|uniref:REP-associated tyrosine transposase n=1 Tax=Proteiniborus sp. MB09-C3 TaxID=3050072 RepID=UPI0025532F13|nr:transposase [Proteiniborus sp. MB09-C3]WIV10403.1 transposase [Proteiniborus sp. MB09-C3]